MKKLIALALLTISALSHANPHQTVRVDLRTDEGVKDTFNAISMAAENSCPYIGDKSIRHQEIFRQCRREAIESAVYRIHDIRLARYAATRSN